MNIYIMFTMKVKAPTDIDENFRLRTYGKQDSGAVPKSEMIESAIPRATKKRPMVANI